MKKLNSCLILCVIGSLLMLTSCNKDKPVLIYDGSDFIAFQDTLFGTEENTAEYVKLVVMRASSVSDAIVTVDLTISSPDNTAVAGEDYEILSPSNGKITFGVGDFFDTIVVHVIDNVLEDGAKTIGFELSGEVQGYVLGMPGPDQKQKYCELVISDNDCAYLTRDFSGTISGIDNLSYMGDAPSVAEFTLVDSSATIYTFEVTGIMQPSFTTWGEIVDVGGDSNGDVAILYYDFTDPFNPTIYFEEQNLATTNGGAWIYDLSNDPLMPSKFSSCNRTVELYYLINVSEPGQDYGPNTAYTIGEFVDK